MPGKVPGKVPAKMSHQKQKVTPKNICALLGLWAGWDAGLSCSVRGDDTEDFGGAVLSSICQQHPADIPGLGKVRRISAAQPLLGHSLQWDRCCCLHDAAVDLLLAGPFWHHSAGHPQVCLRDRRLQAKVNPGFLHPQYIFPDIHLLSGDVVTDVDGKETSDTSSTFIAVGIECDSISSLNGDRAGNYDCSHKEDTATKTGTTARAAIQYITKKRPPLFLFENVRNLQVAGKSGISNLQWLVSQANLMGYHVVYMLLDSSMYGMPQHRERLYLIGVKTSEEAVPLQFQDKFVEPAWASELKQFIRSMQIEPFPLGDFICSDLDDEVIRANAARCEEDIEQQANRKAKKSAARSKARKSAGSEDEEERDKYELEHLNEYFQNGVKWPPSMPAEFLKKAACLATRCQQILFLEEAMRGPAAASACLWVRDLNMTMQWGRWREGRAPCIVSTSMFWVRGTHQDQSGNVIVRDRKMSGKELLNLQGFDCELQERAQSEYTDAMKSDLAGNAFCAAVLFPIITAIVACAPLSLAFCSSSTKKVQQEEQAAEDTDHDGLVLDPDHSEELMEEEERETDELVIPDDDDAFDLDDLL